MTARALWALYWAVWFAGLFGIVDVALVVTHHAQYSLTDNVLALEGHGWTALRYAVAAFMVWAAGHLVFGWWMG